jgi:2-polyprenyl-3-methyl-5-hydroxy-6-metoxy-1,4-benzoquinol methylase
MDKERRPGGFGVKSLDRLAARLGAPVRRRITGLLAGVADKVAGRRARRVYFGQDYVDREIEILNLKALGYEVGRALAREMLSRKVERAPEVELRPKLCTQADVETDWFIFWAREMNVAPIYHRKLWELSYIAQALWHAGKLRPGMTGLGFGCGQEVLPSLFAKYGAQILATDLAPDRPEAKEWSASRQYAASAEALRRRDICPDETLLAAIEFRHVDMKAIPQEFAGKFDFCWSACALEHLGSIANGLRFIEDSLTTLKPGGLAVHTSEFNLGTGATVDHRNTVLYQERHVAPFAQRLRAQGYEIAELDFSRGEGVLDNFVDTPPWPNETLGPRFWPYACLKAYLQGFTCTSFGLIVRSRPTRASSETPVPGEA